MHPFFAVQSIYYVIYSAVVFLIVVLSYRMVSLARRKRLTTFLYWLVPAAAAATSQTLSCLISDAFLSGVRERFAIFTFHCLLGVISSLMLAVAVVRLWRVIKAHPEHFESKAPERSPMSENGETWPPPPKIMR